MRVRDVLEVISIVFAAGGFFVWVKMSLRTLRRDLTFTGESLDRDIRGLGQSLRHDVNGLGAKVRARVELEEQRQRRTLIALLRIAPKEAQDKIGELMKD